MQEHLTNILQLIDKLAVIGERISDSHISAIMLCSLSRSYNVLITALESRPEIDLTSDFLRKKLIDKYTRRIENTDILQTAPKAYKIQKNLAYANNRKENMYCTHCQIRNHNTAQCWFVKKQKQNNYTQQHNNHSHPSKHYNQKQIQQHYL